MTLILNPDLNLDALRDEFATKDRIRIDNILSDESAETMADTLKNTTSWHLVHSDEVGQPKQFTPEELAEIDEVQYQEMIDTLNVRATSNYQYAYKFHPIIDSIQAGRLTEISMLFQMANFLNGTEFIRFARALTDTDSLVKVDPQATLYERGHFLNIHDDMGDNRTAQDSSVRRFAIVMGFTKNWSPNWGGQTNFYPSSHQPISESWNPGFNTLTIFRVPVLHNVSYVTPFAPKGRYSITGWLRDDPRVERPDLDSDTA